jgi:hypothetical protein
MDCEPGTLLWSEVSAMHRGRRSPYLHKRQSLNSRSEQFSGPQGILHSGLCQSPLPQKLISESQQQCCDTVELIKLP